MQHHNHRLPSQAHTLRHSKRRQVEDLLALAEYLPSTDRNLIQQVLGSDLPISQIAKLYQRPARHLHRQSKSIIKRLSDKHFKFVAIQIKTLPPEVRTTARHVILHGLSLRKAAEVSGKSLHHIRQDMNTVRAAARIFS